jgi:hypothetical protein
MKLVSSSNYREVKIYNDICFGNCCFSSSYALFKKTNAMSRTYREVKIYNEFVSAIAVLVLLMHFLKRRMQ